MRVLGGYLVVILRLEDDGWLCFPKNLAALPYTIDKKNLVGLEQICG